MKLTLHKNPPLVIACLAGAIALVVSLVLGLPFDDLTVQLGLLGLCMYPIAVGMEWLAIRR